MLTLGARARIYVAAEAIDLRKYAARVVMRSCTPRRPSSERETTAAGPHNQGLVREGRSEAISLSAARKRPRRRPGGSTASMASSFAVGSARR